MCCVYGGIGCTWDEEVQRPPVVFIEHYIMIDFCGHTSYPVPYYIYLDLCTISQSVLLLLNNNSLKHTESATFSDIERERSQVATS